MLLSLHRPFCTPAWQISSILNSNLLRVWLPFDLRKWSYLVEQKNEVDGEAHKQSQETQVVEVSGQVVLKRKHYTFTACVYRNNFIKMKKITITSKENVPPVMVWGNMRMLKCF